MQIKKLKLTNAFQHANLEMDFQAFQGIVGANGSGKSNLLEAAAFALTGAFTLPGKMESMVREGQEKGKVELTVESEGELIEIVAHLGKSNRTLSRESQKLKITKATEVLEYLERQVLRTPFNIVNSSSIVRQGQLDAGLFDTQAKRTDAFLRMAGLSDIEKKRQALADAKAMVTVPMLSFTVAETEKKVQEIKDYLAKVWAERNAIPVTDATKLDAYRTFIATVAQIEKARAELVGAEKKLAELAQLAKEAKSLVDEKQAVWLGHKKQEELIRPQVDQAKIRISQFERAKKDWADKCAIQLSVQDCQAKVSALVAPSEKYEGPDPKEFEALMREVEVKKAEAQKTADAFSKPVASCPTCRRTCTEQEAKQFLAEAKADISEFDAVYAEACKAVAEAVTLERAWQSSRRQYETTRDKLTSLLTYNEAALAKMKDVTQPVADAKDQEAVAYYSQLLVTVHAAWKEEREANDLLNTTVVQLASMESKVSELTAQTRAQDGAIGVSVGDAKAFIAEHEQRVRKISELDGLIHGTEKQLADEVARLTKLAEESEKAKTLTQYCDYLEFARTALHRDNFPSGKVKAFVDRMLITANMYLDTMQSGFSVSYDKDMGFIAFFPRDNKHMRADRLSGGEKVTFALAFRFAVNDIHTDTGFLILDEPTVWLDDKHIDYVINALALVKTKLVPRVQLIIVTHDEKLAAVADSVYEVKKG